MNYSFSKLMALCALLTVSNNFFNIESANAASLTGQVAGMFDIELQTQLGLTDKAIYTFDKSSGNGVFRAFGENFTLEDATKTENELGIFDIEFTIISSNNPNLNGFFEGNAGGDNTGTGTIPLTLNNVTTLVNFSATNVTAQHVPEPTSALGFLAVGTLGAASTLKRRLKSSNPADKELEKVS
ncbi:PEP-CTERM sorting domain-containing protein [Okeania sp. KiyG1]|uniref:PEP-CTERM sorting domain-containing protein n=1 Tax=Okeania sp. KiyG1 TaxID=2720165 RepID=UPI0019233E57|nr:PEP-CTERM sorting domain-containing protein [Okeania sp. KiyG1]GGA04019.1 hypothetical protein CYANOKiyG1_16260 [Okeania sp. KiyG1]